MEAGGAGLTFAGAAVHREPEAHRAAAVVGARCVLTLVATQAPGVALALVDVWKRGAGGSGHLLRQQGHTSPSC